MDDTEDLMLTLAQFPLTMADLIQRIASQKNISPVRRRRLMGVHGELTKTAAEATKALAERRVFESSELLGRLQKAIATLDDAMGDLEAGVDAWESSRS